jgi:hypothetical protein
MLADLVNVGLKPEQYCTLMTGRQKKRILEKCVVRIDSELTKKRPNYGVVVMGKLWKCGRKNGHYLFIVHSLYTLYANDASKMKKTAYTDAALLLFRLLHL